MAAKTILLLKLDYDGGDFDTTAMEVFTLNSIPEGWPPLSPQEKAEYRWMRVEVKCQERNKEIATYVRLFRCDERFDESDGEESEDRESE